MDWTIILDFVAQAGTALAPIIATVVMLIVGTLFYRLTGLLPGFVRAYVERAYREKEALFRDAITKRVNGGTNGLADRQAQYTRAALVLLGYGPGDVRKFQTDAGLRADGIVGPKTRDALHRALSSAVPVTFAGQAATPAPTPAQPANPFAALIAWLNRIFGV